MGANTSRLGLYLPGGGSTGLITPDEDADIDDINDNMRKIDEAIGLFLCTSTTRPASPFPGQEIYERDTFLHRYWENTTSEWLVIGIDKADITTFGANWKASEGSPHKPRLRREGDHIFLFGGVVAETGASGLNLFSLPTPFRPLSGGTRFIGPTVTSNGGYFEMALANGVVSLLPGYGGGASVVNNTNVPLNCDWWDD